MRLPHPAVLCLLAALLSGFLAAEEEQQKTPAPYGGAPHTIPGLIEAEHYDEGPAEVAYHDLEAVNQGVAYRKDTQVDIEQRPDASNGHGVGWTRTGEWLIYTVEVKETGRYTVEFPVASNKEGGIFHIEAAGKDLTGPIKVPDTGGWGTLKIIKKEGVELGAGQHQFKVVMDEQGPSGSIGDIDYLKFSREPSAAK